MDGAVRDMVEEWISKAKSCRVVAFFASAVRRDMGLPYDTDGQVKSVLDSMVAEGCLGEEFKFDCPDRDCCGTIVVTTLPKEGQELTCPICGEAMEYEGYYNMDFKRYTMPQ